MGNLWKWLKHRAGGDGPDGPKRSNVLKLLLIVGLVGVALMILNSFIHVKKVTPIGNGRDSPGTVQKPQAQETFSKSGDTGQADFSQYEQAYENQMKQILDNIVGVSEAKVLVTLDSTEQIQVAKENQTSQTTSNEQDSNGGIRKTTSVTQDGKITMTQSSGGQRPLVLTYIKPKIRGVVVVAKGAQNPVVEKMITEAVERGLGVPGYKISVLPSKS